MARDAKGIVAVWNNLTISIVWTVARRWLLAAGTVPAAARSAPTRFRARAYEPVLTPIIVCEVSTVVAVVVVVSSLCCNFFAAHGSNSHLCSMC